MNQPVMTRDEELSAAFQSVREKAAALEIDALRRRIADLEDDKRRLEFASAVKQDILDQLRRYEGQIANLNKTLTERTREIADLHKQVEVLTPQQDGLDPVYARARKAETERDRLQKIVDSQDVLIRYHVERIAHLKGGAS